MVMMAKSPPYMECACEQEGAYAALDELGVVKEGGEDWLGMRERRKMLAV
ncbi:predicted protein [Plenodomus lingam JN3]|uniref:Predicted protein n=1 Tax=Leptosphaeria maculans (strain JN3 / isolate v23.1.3 / race Av1-4-5-6-7-8) TaxID=985895 RepID=E4ZRD4_LEPMJ|nr:predicted protein [Plenodomus lingam JN3]CBX93799.1 predicted protein [Plenodomus lingam JN3]